MDVLTLWHTSTRSRRNFEIVAVDQRHLAEELRQRLSREQAGDASTEHDGVYCGLHVGNRAPVVDF